MVLICFDWKRFLSELKNRVFLVMVKTTKMKLALTCTYKIKSLALHSNRKLNAQHRKWSENTWNSLHELVTIALIISYHIFWGFLCASDRSRFRSIHSYVFDVCHACLSHVCVISTNSLEFFVRWVCFPTIQPVSITKFVYIVRAGILTRCVQKKW